MTTPTSETYITDIAFTDAVKQVQSAKGSRDGYAKMEQKGGWSTTVSNDLAAFIANVDSFYLATTNGDGQPYIQHRGGPKGFLKVLGDNTLGFADLVGNRQYISMGNLAENDKAFIFLMDYANKHRIKIWGRARMVEGDADLLDRLRVDAGRDVAEHAVLFDVAMWDSNCPRQITPRYTEDQIGDVVQSLKQRIIELEAQLAERTSKE